MYKWPPNSQDICQLITNSMAAMPGNIDIATNGDAIVQINPANNKQF